jgi:hypothetical protein
MDKQQYEQALARAKAEGCRIIGETAYEGTRAWTVINPRHDGSYTVRLAAGAKELTCNCPARVYCKHRALVHEALEREARRGGWSLGDGNGQRITVGMLRIAREAALSQPRMWS